MNDLYQVAFCTDATAPGGGNVISPEFGGLTKVRMSMIVSPY